MSFAEADAKVDARERVLSAAYSLFARRGVRAVGVDEIISTAEVAKATFYRHFPSKEALVLAFLQRRDEVFGADFAGAEVHQRSGNPEDQLLAMFDVLGEWFAAQDFEGCPFIKVLMDAGADTLPGQASVIYLAKVRGLIGLLAEEAGLKDVDELTRSWHILMKGSVIAAAEGDVKAAARAQRMARTLIAEHRPAFSHAG